MKTKLLLLSCLLTACSETPLPWKYHYGDKLKMLGGFYKGCIATVLEIGKHYQNGDSYIVDIHCDGAFVIRKEMMIDDTQ